MKQYLSPEHASNVLNAVGTTVLGWHILEVEVVEGAPSDYCAVDVSATTHPSNTATIGDVIEELGQ